MSSTLDGFYREVARVALAVAEKYSFALGGGLAWITYGLVDRSTQRHRLDRLDDRLFARYGLVGTAVDTLRDRLAAWPRPRGTACVST